MELLFDYENMRLEKEGKLAWLTFTRERYLAVRRLTLDDYDAAHRDAMATHELGDRVMHQIGAQLQRPAEVRRGEGVIHN